MWERHHRNGLDWNGRIEFDAGDTGVTWTKAIRGLDEYGERMPGTTRPVTPEEPPEAAPETEEEQQPAPVVEQQPPHWWIGEA